MGKKQDIMWEQSTLWESVEKWVTKYLKKNHSGYRELQVKAMRIVDENPALRILINNIEGIVLTPEDHKALHKYIETKDELEKQLLDESEEYQNCIKEEENSEEEVKRKLSSKEWKLVDRYVTAVNNRWLCCGDYLYQSGMKDILLLMENR